MWFAPRSTVRTRRPERHPCQCFTWNATPARPRCSCQGHGGTHSPSRSAPDEGRPHFHAFLRRYQRSAPRAKRMGPWGKRWRGPLGPARNRKRSNTARTEVVAGLETKHVAVAPRNRSFARELAANGSAIEDGQVQQACSGGQAEVVTAGKAALRCHRLAAAGRVVEARRCSQVRDEGESLGEATSADVAAGVVSRGTE